MAITRNLISLLKVEGCRQAFTFTSLLELPHQPAERDGHDTNEYRSQAKDNIDGVVRGYVSRIQYGHS